MNLFPSGPRWWLGLAAVTGLLILSVVGEYYVIDRKDARYDLAAVGLNILGLTLLAIVLSALHAGQARLAFALPLIAVLVAAIAERLLDLSDARVPETRYFSVGIGLLVSELALPLFYLPLSSVTFGLLLTLATHTGVGIAQAHVKEKNIRSVVLEYLFIDAVAVGHSNSCSGSMTAGRADSDRHAGSRSATQRGVPSHFSSRSIFGRKDQASKHRVTTPNTANHLEEYPSAARTENITSTASPPTKVVTEA